MQSGTAFTFLVLLGMTYAGRYCSEQCGQADKKNEILKLLVEPDPTHELSATLCCPVKPDLRMCVLVDLPPTEIKGSPAGDPEAVCWCTDKPLCDANSILQEFEYEKWVQGHNAGNTSTSTSIIAMAVAFLLAVRCCVNV